MNEHCSFSALLARAFARRPGRSCMMGVCESFRGRGLLRPSWTSLLKAGGGRVPSDPHVPLSQRLTTWICLVVGLTLSRGMKLSEGSPMISA
jgi:hypothetical protein